MNPDPTILPTEPAPGAVEQMLDMLALGGPVVAILVVMSVIALAIALLKAYQFTAARLGDRKTVRHALELLGDKRYVDAQAIADASPNPSARLLVMLLRGRARGIPESRLREEAHRMIAATVESLGGLLRPLEVIASLAPLLGLFGTVLGMITAFRQLEQAGSQVDPSILSGGIWEALLTTAVGLAVAIPAVAMVAWIERRIDRTAHEMEDLAARIFAEGATIDRPVEERHESARLASVAAGE